MTAPTRQELIEALKISERALSEATLPFGYLYQPRGGSSKWMFAPVPPEGEQWAVKAVYADDNADELQGARSALKAATIKIAKLEAEKADLANKVLIYAYRAEQAALTAPSQPAPAVDREEDAELVRELREEAMRLSGHSLERGCVDSGIAANLADRAADRLEALSGGR